MNKLSPEELKYELSKLDRRNFQNEVEFHALINLLAELERVKCLVTIELIKRAK